jgi:structural maintenance of chromosome 1
MLSFRYIITWQQVEDNSQIIVKKNKDLAGLRQEQSIHDNALESARADQAKT